MAAILVADIAPGPKPRRNDSIRGTGDTIDFVHQIESGLQTGGRGHGKTIRREKRRSIGESAAADHLFACVG
jgi:hypothetical protein